MPIPDQRRSLRTMKFDPYRVSGTQTGPAVALFPADIPGAKPAADDWLVACVQSA
jgi:hypothetical protein